MLPMQQTVQVSHFSSNKNNGSAISKVEFQSGTHKIWKPNIFKKLQNNKNSFKDELLGNFNLSEMYTLNCRNTDLALEAFYPHLFSISSKPHDKKQKSTSNMFSGDNSQLVNENMKRYRKTGSFLSPSQIPKDNQKQTIIMNFSEMLRSNFEDSKFIHTIKNTESHEKTNLIFKNKCEDENVLPLNNSCEKLKKNLIIESISSPISETEKNDKNSSFCSPKKMNKFQKSTVFSQEKQFDIYNTKSLWFLRNYSAVNYLHKDNDPVFGAPKPFCRSMSNIRTAELQDSFAEKFSQKPLEKTFIALGTNGAAIYIHKPLLLEGRKADIRSYMLIASTAPFLILFNPGYVRLSCFKYDVGSNDMCVHLTNQCMQKKDPQYILFKESTVWSIQQLNDYVNKNIAPEKNLECDWVYSSFVPRMRRAMMHCFIAGKKKLESRIGYFELLGFDFLIDENLKVWLLEINVNPSFSTNCCVLQNVIPAVLKESLDVSIECFEKNRYNIPLLPLESLKNFSVLYCGENMSASLPKKMKSKKKKYSK